jgi:hypothetical protein
MIKPKEDFRTVDFLADIRTQDFPKRMQLCEHFSRDVLFKKSCLSMISDSLAVSASIPAFLYIEFTRNSYQQLGPEVLVKSFFLYILKYVPAMEAKTATDNR